MVPSKSIKALSNTSLLSISKWLVGSSSIKKLSSCKASFVNVNLAFSPPERLCTTFLTSSPINKKLPNNERTSFSNILG